MTEALPNRGPARLPEHELEVSRVPQISRDVRVAQDRWRHRCRHAADLAPGGASEPGDAEGSGGLGGGAGRGRGHVARGRVRVGRAGPAVGGGGGPRVPQPPRATAAGVRGVRGGLPARKTRRRGLWPGLAARGGPRGGDLRGPACVARGEEGQGLGQGAVTLRGRRRDLPWGYLRALGCPGGPRRGGGHEGQAVRAKGKGRGEAGHGGSRALGRVGPLGEDRFHHGVPAGSGKRRLWGPAGAPKHVWFTAAGNTRAASVGITVRRTKVSAVDSAHLGVTKSCVPASWVKKAPGTAKPSSGMQRTPDGYRYISAAFCDPGERGGHNRGPRARPGGPARTSAQPHPAGPTCSCPASPPAPCPRESRRMDPNALDSCVVGVILRRERFGAVAGGSNNGLAEARIRATKPARRMQPRVRCTFMKSETTRLRQTTARAAPASTSRSAPRAHPRHDMHARSRRDKQPLGDDASTGEELAFEFFVRQLGSSSV